MLNINLNALPVYDGRYIKTKIGTYVDDVYTNFHGLNVPEIGAEYETFIIIYIDLLLFGGSKYHLQDIKIIMLIKF